MEVTKELIAEWKVLHGKVFKTNSAGNDIYYKLLNRTDYLNIMQKQAIAQATGQNIDPELETFRVCVLNESDFTDETLSIIGGLVSSVYEQVMIKSGFTVAESEEL